MIRVQDVVVYGIDGVCIVAGTTSRKVSGRMIEYYVLKPIEQENTTVYVPMDNMALVGRMQHLLSLDEVTSIIKSIPDEETIWIDDNVRRHSLYGQIILGNDRLELLRLIKTLHQQDQKLKQNHRKLPTEDQRLMKAAEKRLYDEFAQVLRIEPSQVLPYIFNMIGKQARAEA